MDIGYELKQIRKDLDLTQQEFAKKIGLSRTYLSDLENNRYDINLKTLKNAFRKIEGYELVIKIEKEIEYESTS